MQELQIYRHPEWKRLYDEVEELLEPGRLLTYEDLQAAAGIDIKTTKGRAQFHRFADHVLRTLNLHFENVPNVGYRIVLPSEHGRSAVNQINRAKRRVKKAGQIASHVRAEALTPQQISMLADIQARTGRIEQMLREQTKTTRKIADTMLRPERLPAPALEAALEKEQKVH